MAASWEWEREWKRGSLHGEPSYGPTRESKKKEKERQADPPPPQLKQKCQTSAHTGSSNAFTANMGIWILLATEKGSVRTLYAASVSNPLIVCDTEWNNPIVGIAIAAL